MTSCHVGECVCVSGGSTHFNADEMWSKGKFNLSLMSIYTEIR